METRNCQNCKNAFVIEDEDFDFYAKINVPPPTFCPQCRLQRRLIWMKGIQLFKRKCDLCHEERFSMYHPDAPYVVYCDRCWWSDKWDAKDLAMDYDPMRPFLEQWNELLHKAPLLGLSIDQPTSNFSQFCNHVGHSKNCYLLFYSDFCEEHVYGFYGAQNKNVLNCSFISGSEKCFDCVSASDNFHVVGSHGMIKSIDTTFCYDCNDCNNCFGSINLQHASNVFFNEQLSKEEYKQKMSEIDLGSYSQYQEYKKKAYDHFKKYSPRPVYDLFSDDKSSGSYFSYCKNSKECYAVSYAEDSKYLMLIKFGPVKDSYDYVDWGNNSNRIYEAITVGEGAQDIYFTHESGHGLLDVQYSKLSITAEHHFGCVSLKKNNYSILNKQYSKEEFEKLREQIKKDMDANPYISTEGHVYKYGEFFPPEFSPNFYNDSFAARFFPLNKEQVQVKGLKWYEPENREYAVTVAAKYLPDNIKDASDTILQEVIGCSTCNRGFRVIGQELQFLRQHTLPLPRSCPFCRIWEKVDIWVSNMQQLDRACDKCGKEFKTFYTKDRAPVIYCKQCYQQEYL